MSTNATQLNDAATELFELAALHDKLLHKWGDIATGTGDSSKESIVSVKRPWIDPPQGSLTYDERQVVALGGIGSTVTVVTITVPDGYDGVIQAYSWNLSGGGFVQGSGDLVAQILRDGTPIRNFDNILVEAGTIGQPRNISPIRIYSKQVITLTVFHSANAAVNGNLVGSLLGYFYPAQG